MIEVLDGGFVGLGPTQARVGMHLSRAIDAERDTLSDLRLNVCRYAKVVCDGVTRCLADQ